MIFEVYVASIPSPFDRNVKLYRGYRMDATDNPRLQRALSGARGWRLVGSAAPTTQTADEQLESELVRRMQQKFQSTETTP